MDRSGSKSFFRALEPWELDLVSGGDGSGEDIVVYGGGGGGGGGFYGGCGGDGDGDGGGGDGGGGGGGGGGEGDVITPPPIHVADDNGQSVTIQPSINQSTKVAELDVTAANSSGSFTLGFEMDHFDLKTFNLTIFNGSSNYSALFNVDTNAVTGTYALDFGGGATGSFSLTTNGASYSIGITFKASL